MTSPKRVTVLHKYVPPNERRPDDPSYRDIPVEIVTWLVRPAWEGRDQYGQATFGRGGIVAVVINGDRYEAAALDDLRRVSEPTDD